MERERLDALTGLRFLAAFAIVIHHSRDTFIPAPVIQGLPLGNAVSFFFVLSGFILAYNYRALLTAGDVVKFYVARLARLWPIHALSFLTVLVLSPHVRFVSNVAVANLMLVQAWIPLQTFYFSYNAVSWSISTELGFYLLFPLLIWNFRKWWPMALLVAFAAAIVMVLVSERVNLAPPLDPVTNPTPFGLLYFNPLSRLLEFVLGMCGALLWRTAPSKLTRNVVLWTALEMAAVALLIAYLRYWHGPVLSAARTIYPVSGEWLQHIVLAPFFLVIILVMASGAGFIAKALGTRAMIFLGEISYALYMFHAVTIMAFKEYASSAFWDIDMIPRFLVLCATLLVICSAAYLLVEKPAREAARHRGPRLVERQRAGMAP